MRSLDDFSRPFLRRDVPVAWIGDDLIRIGVGPRAVTAHGTRSQVAWLAAMDGTGQRPDPGDVADGTDPSALVSAAIAAGAIDDAARIPRAWRWLPSERRWLMEPVLLAAMHVYDNDDARKAIDRRLACSIAVPGSSALVHEVRAAVVCAGLGVSESTEADLVVIADGDPPALVDPSLATASHGPHLFVRCFGATAQIGPLIVPGSTSCTRCAELHRLDGDRRWAAERAAFVEMSARLVIRPEDPLLLRAAALQAVALVRTWADGVLPASVWADRSATITLPTLDICWQEQRRHPLCGCGWPAG